MERIRNYIGGELVEAAGGGLLEDVEPATGRVYAHLPDSAAEDVAQAVGAAAEAWAAWSHTPAEVRCRLLMAVADRLEACADELALAESRDTGKPVSLARRVDIPRAVRNFRFFATAILHARTEAHITDYEAVNYTLRRPCGVVGAISPWNLPLYLLSWKVAPALATGNTVVAKPSELAPLTAYRLAEICAEVGLPAGVLNIVHGRGAVAGAALVAEPRVRAITFTGGTETGRAIARVAAERFAKVALEMGGKNATIVFADADLEEAVAGALRAGFANQGQVCLCGSRVFVQREVYEGFVSRFVAGAERLRVGDPLEPTTEQGALISAEHREKVERYVSLAREEGGEVLCGGKRPAPPNERCAGGYFFEPTVVEGVGPACRVNQEEIFGPVVCVMPFDEEEVVAWANGTRYGLCASVWTRDVERAHRVADALEVGTVWVNCWMLRDLRVPFGGMKESGVGREGGEEALRFFTEPRNVCVRVGRGSRQGRS